MGDVFDRLLAELLLRPDGAVWRSRIQSYDSTFGLERTDAITLHHLSAASEHPSLPAVSVFDDSKLYWRSQTPTAGVKNPNTGTQIRVKAVRSQGSFMEVGVRPSR